MKEQVLVAKTLLQDVAGKELPLPAQIEKTIELAKILLAISNKLKKRSEKKREARLAEMIKDPHSKALFAAVTDSCFRSKERKRTAEYLRYLINPDKKYALLASFVKKMARFALKVFPRTTVSLLRVFLRSQVKQVIAPGEPKLLRKRIKKWEKQGVKVNLNRLGEAILGDKEAKKRLDTILRDLADPAISIVSVKISSICSQITLLDWDTALTELKERMRLLYRTKKYINLDMEEYKDLQLTIQLFCEVLDEPEFLETQAGIALQSYLPDSFAAQERLTTWAMARKERGGAPIKIRIVKGANLGMEKVEASIKEWPQAPYKTKAEVDANFKKMLQYGLQPGHSNAVHIGIASHNLFDIAYAMILSHQNNVAPSVCFEMLAGMAPSMQRAVTAIWPEVLLYCPVATKDAFYTAIAYLFRRLDENSSPDNFLAHLFDLETASQQWQKQAALFAKSCLHAPTVSAIPRREQNRLLETPSQSTRNEPDTDWSLEPNRIWASCILSEWKEARTDIPLVINGKEFFSSARAIGLDPSQPNRSIHTYCNASQQEIDKALFCAYKQAQTWASTPLAERIALFYRAADLFRGNRHNLIGAMVQESGKIIAEADGEVSEAIDFLTYYAKRLSKQQGNTRAFQTAQVALVLTPWNFPCSIPCSAITSALACGYSVIFKPAPEAVLSGWQLASLFWQAGVPKEVLQFVPCEESPTGWQLIEDPRVGIVILTGATATAKSFLQKRPLLRLFGETGGKNSMIVSSLSDRDQAVKEVIHSAFGYAGQKCSACSLLILEEEVYYSKSFREQLFDAASTLRTGSSWEAGTIVNPLIRPASPHLSKALTCLDKGEEWLLKPVQDRDNPQLWSPGIKFGVKRGSYTHQTELFGPLLAVMCAKDLKEAVAIANEAPYGLTAGIISLDKREQDQWIETIEAGNCYINRSITGAIVDRQPFGGCKASSFGMGMKVGGPNYLLQLADKACYLSSGKGVLDPSLKKYLHSLNLSKEDLSYVKEGLTSYTYWWNSYFTRQHTIRGLVGQNNFLRFAPKSPLFILTQEGDDQRDLALLVGACLICGCTASFCVESEITDQLASVQSAHVRALQPPSQELLEAITPHIACLDTSKPSQNGRIELLSWLREVSISHDYHRYGSVHEN